MAVTGHFVDSDWVLQKRVLNFCNVPPPHTGVIIADALSKCFLEWGIENKVSTITVDNASYNDVCIRRVKEDFSLRKRLSIGGKIFHVRCCAHILNLLVQDGLNQIVDVIDVVREGIKYLKNSESHLNEFAKIKKQLQLPSKKLILDCPTRWNSTYLMLASALEFRDVFPRHGDIDPGFMAESMAQKFDKYWGESNVLMSLGAILDPRYKMVLVNHTFPVIYGEGEAPRYIDEIRCILYDLYNEYVDAHISSHSEEPQREAGKRKHAKISSKSTQGAAKKLGVNVLTGKEKFQMIVSEIDKAPPEKSDLDVFLEEGRYVCDANANLDVLGWWKRERWRFPISSRLASDVLAIPVTTVASKYTFSAGGRIIDDRRQKKAEYVQALHEKVRANIERRTAQYVQQANKGCKKVVFEPGDWVWLHFHKDRFLAKRLNKLSSHGDGPFQVLERINDNAYRLDLLGEYNVSTTFNVSDLSAFLADNDINLRINLSQEEGMMKDFCVSQDHVGPYKHIDGVGTEKWRVITLIRVEEEEP
ncbi:zinc finger BED domain-containing protein RICESLEEPER 1-like [Coffea arabica]|uniref:Zinc finger BED domain-containing protein RICESLEEPER 1-like n=1 Tax=Coffea arabica TaxID=13443 RepID=A0ABM4X560_COFAR